MKNQGILKVASIISLIIFPIWLTLRFRCSHIPTSINHRDYGPVRPIQIQDDHEPVYNTDIKNLRQKGLSNSLWDIDLNKMSTEELLLTIHSYLDNAQTICDRKLRMGNLGDGGWEICDDPDVRPKPPCIIYSFGINYDFSFDDQASSLYGCHVFSFDPSMKKFPNKMDRSPLVHFYKIGLSNANTTTSKNWTLKAFSDIRAMLGHATTNIDIIKMDIEESEWAALPEMISSGQLTTVRQLMVEYHVKHDTRPFLLSSLQTLQALEKAGFKKYYVNKNPVCIERIQGYPIARSHCYEIHYTRR